VPYVAPVLIAWWIKNRRWIIISAALGSVLTIAGFFLSPEGGTSWVVLTNRGLALFAIWTAAILSYQRRSALRDLQLSEIQTREETALTQIGRVITSSLDINHVYQRFTEQVNTLIPFDRATIILVDHERDVLITAHQEGIDVPQRRAGTATPLAGSLTSAIVRTASSVSVHATDRDELARQYSGLLPAFDAGLVSFLAAPLISRDRVIGLIQLGSTNPSAFGQREIALVERVADQIAGSVANSELFVHAEQVSQERDILAEIGRIMTSSLNISEVYDRFAHAVSRLLPYDRMSMTTIDHEEGKRVILHASGTPVSNWISGMNQPLEGTFTDTVIQSGAPATFDEQQLHARNPDLLTAGLRSTLSLPIISHGESIGAFHLHRKDPDGFSRREVQLVEQISAQIAGAIANERLRHDLERDARERAVLVEISRVIGSSLDIHHVYEQFAEIVGTLISSDRVHINLLSDDLETSTMEFVYGVSVPERSEGQRIQVAGTFNEALIREQKAIVHLPITEEDTRKRYPGLMPSVNAGLQSFLGAPLISNGRMIGTIQWLSYQSGQYSLRDADLGERVAAQIAGALDNANIYAENQQYQTALRQSEQRFSGILDIAEEAVVSVDESFRVTMFNQGAARIFGYEADEVIGESLDVLIPEELISVHQKRISEFATSTDNALHMSERGRQVYGLRKDGAKFPAEASVSRLDMGDTTVFTAILRDITQRKQAEEALRGSEAQYRELYHGAPIAYISSDADGVIVQANQRAAELFGYPLDELVGSPLTRLYAPTPDGIEKAKKVFAERGGSSDGPAVELEYQRADGRQLWGSLSVQQFLDTDGNVLARRSMVVDITERKLLEIQLAQSQKMEAVGQLAGGIAHDFNNLLTAIVGYADLASMDQRQTDSTDRYVRGIKTAAERAAELTRQLLAFSRRQVIVPVVLDLNALILDLNSMLRRIIGEDVELVTVTSADLSAVEADRGQIEQV
ncbi:MAG: PAS domain S-box protein, partial [SAR202 cluster bacterium]|nr:PAS domain S-box protein [SAR202 cluster bacterium]